MTLNELIEQETGYIPFTTFADDFAIAERFGAYAIKDTFKRAFKGWKDNVKYFTELVMVLNWKIWQHYNRNEAVAKVYNECYESAMQYADENLKDEDAHYFYTTLD